MDPLSMEKAMLKNLIEKTGKPMKVDSGIYGKTNQYPANRADAKSPVRKKPYKLKRNLNKRGMK